MSRVILTTALMGVLSAAAGAEPAKPAAPEAKAGVAATPQAPAVSAKAAPAVVVKDLEAVHALVVPMKGSYEQHGDAFGRLFGTLGAQGIRPVGPPFGRYLNDSTQVAEAELLWEIGVPVASDAKAQAPLETRDFAAGKYATLAYDGPQDGMNQAWQQLSEWVAANKLRGVPPAIIAFIGEPGPDGMAVELRLAVEKAE